MQHSKEVICRLRHQFFRHLVSSWACSSFIKMKIVVLVWSSDYNIFCFLDVPLEQKAVFMQFSWNSGVEELIKSLFVREIDSDCCCSISKQLASSPLPVGAQIRLLNTANKKSSPTLSLQNLSASVIETVICRQIVGCTVWCKRP